MPVPTLQSAKIPFFASPPQAIETTVVGWGWPRFRAGQVLDWVYRKFIADPEKMSNLSNTDRHKMCELFTFAESAVVSHQSSSDGTQKLLLSWPNGANAETVMIPDDDRRTACVSSQVGCPVGCTFCASGINGVKGNLTGLPSFPSVGRRCSPRL